MEKINIGFIGCGRIADLHYPGYENNPEVNIYAVCDRQKELALQRKSEWSADKLYTDYREMLRDSDLDAVEILSP
ncbi:MAG: Gfo/Idh/MocA family oxidoreductase, partial [Planctomycetes bacterium]|nr:Gfo/Idh/MocA family oxidoreductase [Planctomycetota bacterium]